MKKTIAAISASLLGIGAAAAAGAAPATAAAPKCTNATQHVVDTSITDFSTADWYMSCIPQYGMGKAEFTIATDAAHPFPAGYSLADGKQTITGDSPTAAEVKSYFGTAFWKAHNTDTGYTKKPKITGAFMNVEETGSTSTSQTYGDGSASSQVGQSVAYRITSVGKATDPFPAACFPGAEDPAATYQGEFEVKYAPTTTTFTEVIKSVKHSVTVTYTPSPLFLGLNFDTSGDGADGFDGNQPLCASSGTNTTQAASESADPGAWLAVDEMAATNSPSYVTTLVPNDLGDGGPPTSLDLGSFAVTSVPVLAETGVDPTVPGLAGGGLLLAGLGAYFVGRRRRRAASAR